MPMLSVVGSRKVSPYGRQVTSQLVREVGQHGVVIISGLALGVDGLAHQAALEVGAKTIAVLPSGIDKIYPATHTQLARDILRQGGAIISEYPDGTEGFKGNFIARNRLVSGLAQAVLITEAAEKSGTLHTANFALEQGKTVLAVPGNITSPLSAGTNNLIKAGATPVTSATDILQALGLTDYEQQLALLPANEQEALILAALQQGTTDAAELLTATQLDTIRFNQTLTMLELTGKIRPLGGGHWSLQ
jgi:DNA processing protein